MPTSRLRHLALFTLISSLLFFSLLSAPYRVFGVKYPTGTPSLLLMSMNQTQFVQIENQSYAIRYDISGGGVVQNMTADSTSKSIIVTISNDSANGGQFKIELPRNLVDANTSQIATGCSQTTLNHTVIWERNHDVPYKIFVTFSNSTTLLYDKSYTSTCAFDFRSLTIDYPPGISEITFQGTVMVPEFPIATIVGTLLPLTMTITIISIKFGRKA